MLRKTNTQTAKRISSFFVFLGVATSLVMLTVVPSSSQAEEAQIQLVRTDFETGMNLLHPENASVLIQGTEGRFTPPKALLFLGATPMAFSVNEAVAHAMPPAILSLVTINGLKSKDVRLSLDNDSIVADVTLEDNPRAIEGMGGVLAFSNVKVRVEVQPNSKTSDFELKDSNFTGDFKASGFLLLNRVIQGAAPEIADSIVKNEIPVLIKDQAFQSSIKSGLLLYAGIQTGVTWTRVKPGSVRIQNNVLSYTVQR